MNMFNCLLHYYHHHHYCYLWCIFFFFTMMMISLPQFATSSFRSNPNNIVKKNFSCLHDQSSALLQFKASFEIFESNVPSKLLSWNAHTDCCSNWKGVSCDNKGYVTGLDASGSGLMGPLNSTSSLFHLHHLRSLSLAKNYIDFNSVPTTFNRLRALTRLDLSGSSFNGKAPVDQICQLITVISNISSLTELLINNAQSSECPATDWCKAISSSQLYNLRVLSFSDSGLLGPLDNSCLSNLSSLSHLDLSLNGITQFPKEFLLHLPNLQTLDISFNSDQTGSFPEFPQQSILQQLWVTETKFSGTTLPESIGNLKLLTELYLSECELSGPVPSSFSNLSHLVRLDMSDNNFTGLVPSLNSSSKTSIIIIKLSNNQFSGPIHAYYFDDQLPNLQTLDLSSNFLTGAIPSSLFALPSLKTLWLHQNRLDSELQEFNIASSSLLAEINLSDNLLQGRIPTSFSQLSSLKFFLLSSNKFNGKMDPRIFQNKRNLTAINLSDNRLLSIDASNIVLTIPNLNSFSFSSCNLTEFPTFLKYNKLRSLDLSVNQLHGQIPKWIWSRSIDLNLSHNSLVDFEQANLPADILSSTRLETVDLRGNMLKGLIPILPTRLSHLLLKDNNFVDIPISICNASNLRTLDLSNNQISRSIPPCLAMLPKLEIVDLSKNKFHGSIPQNLGNFSDLTALNFNRNLLQGPVPRSLAKCKRLEVLDLGNNRINDTFPSWLQGLEELQLLILRSNRFHGPITHNIPRLNMTSFPRIHIIDISSNNLVGRLPLEYFKTSVVMTTVNEGNRDKIQSSNGLYYRYSLVVSNKGQQLTYGYEILYIFNVLDLSSNKFEGEIPESIGEFKSIAVLNLSNNHLAGKIPLSLANVTELQSLDLSSNDLSGEIPSELAKLTFLSVINLSWNRLVGRIPTGAQFNTFSNSSFQGNSGLCGTPLQIECNHRRKGDRTNNNAPSSSSSEEHYIHENSATSFDWIFASAGYAAGLVIGVVVEHFVLPKNMRYLSMILKIETFIQSKSKRSQRRIQH